MQPVSFPALPISVRLMTSLSMFMAWVLIAEFVIDRYGIDKHLPYYRYGDICIYDVAAAMAVLGFWLIAHRRMA